MLLFQHLEGAVRKRLLHGPRFSQGLLQAVAGTSAYPRLLAEAHALDVSNIGVGLGDQALMQWLDRILSRQGSRVKCRQVTQTLFDDLVSYCRFEYVTHTHEHRRAAQREKAQEEQRRIEEIRRQAAEARRDRERKAARERRKEEEARRKRDDEADRQRAQHSWYSSSETAGPAAGAHDTPDEAVAHAETFQHLSEARLYLTVARQQAGTRGSVRSFTRNGHFVVELSGPAALKDAVDLAYHRVWSDLQRNAETIRSEAAWVRDEAIRRAESVYAEQCEQAFWAAVDRYTS
ncbi:hypothetical protein [Deinococcus malanensis]|uniref:hypothetical protein n=1 Tax=Deinococcus malanensis TaxID=1706855 RepID=UPI001E47C6D9|nr:hypothetical protein [Deinococcus malanensis]